MPKKNKDGVWEYTEAEEGDIAMAVEVRKRNRQEQAREAQAEKCAAGEHKAAVEGKCPACGVAVKEKPTIVRDIRRSIL